MGHLWRSSFSSPPPQGCGTQPLREEKEERNWMGWDGRRDERQGGGWLTVL